MSCSLFFFLFALLNASSFTISNPGQHKLIEFEFNLDQNQNCQFVARQNFPNDIFLDSFELDGMFAHNDISGVFINTTLDLEVPTYKGQSFTVYFQIPETGLVTLPIHLRYPNASSTTQKNHVFHIDPPVVYKICRLSRPQDLGKSYDALHDVIWHFDHLTRQTPTPISQPPNYGSSPQKFYSLLIVPFEDLLRQQVTWPISQASFSFSVQVVTLCATLFGVFYFWIETRNLVA